MQWKTLRKKVDQLATAEDETAAECQATSFRSTNLVIVGLKTPDGTNNNSTIVSRNGTIVIESDPSEFPQECVEKCDRSSACAKAYRKMRYQIAEQQEAANGCPEGRYSSYSSTESAIGCRATANPPILPSGLNSADQFTGRLMNTEFFSKKKAYADPEQYDDSSGCSVPTRQDLYVVRFVNSDADAQGNTTRTPMIFEVDQKSGLLAPTAKIERSLFDDNFADLSQWEIVDSISRPNYWTVGKINNKNSAYVTYNPGSNDYLAGTESNLSICHLWRDVLIPSDSSSGAMNIQLRVMGNGDISQPTYNGQDFAAVHMIEPNYVPIPDVPISFEHRLEGQMLTNLQLDGRYLLEHLTLRTNATRGTIAGQVKRFVVSFHSGSGLGVQPMALALSRLMIITSVDIPAMKPVAVSPCK
jgi:hypothetical protein